MKCQSPWAEQCQRPSQHSTSLCWPTITWLISWEMWRFRSPHRSLWSFPQDLFLSFLIHSQILEAQTNNMGMQILLKLLVAIRQVLKSLRISLYSKLWVFISPLISFWSMHGLVLLCFLAIHPSIHPSNLFIHPVHLLSLRKHQDNSWHILFNYQQLGGSAVVCKCGNEAERD